MTETPALKTPEFVKVQSLSRGRSGYNIYVKVVKATERQVETKEGQTILMVDAVVADETGSANAFFKGESAKIVKEGAVIAIRNGVKKIIKGHISLEIDLFGRVTPETQNVVPSTDSKNISEEQIKIEPRKQGRRQFKRGEGRGERRRGENRGQNKGENRGQRRENRDNRDNNRDNNRENRRENRENRETREPRRNDRETERRDRQPRRDDRDYERRDDRDIRRDNRRNDRDYDRDYNRRDDRQPRRDDRDYERRGNQDTRGGDRDNRRGGYQQKGERGERGERRPLIKISEIDPGQENLRFIAKVLEATLVSGKNGNNFRLILGDETGTVKAFLQQNDALAVGKTVILTGAESRVVNEHIEIQRARAAPARNPIDKVKESFNLSQKSWVPVD